MDMVAQLRDHDSRLMALEQGATPVAIEPPEGAFVTRSEYDSAMILIHGLINAVDELRFDLDAVRGHYEAEVKRVQDEFNATAEPITDGPEPEDRSTYAGEDA